MRPSGGKRLGDAERFARLLAAEIESRRRETIETSRRQNVLLPELEFELERAYELFRSRAGSSEEAMAIFRAQLERILLPNQAELLRALVARLEARPPPPTAPR